MTDSETRQQEPSKEEKSQEPPSQQEHQEDQSSMSGEDSKDSLKIVRLTRESYQRWRIELEDVLRSKGLWRHATGGVDAVAEPAAGSSEAAWKVYTDWDAKDSRAKTVIRRSLDDSTFARVYDCKTARQILERITSIYDPKSTDVFMTSMTAFFAETWREQDDTTAFLARLAMMAAKVNSCGKDSKITDEMVIGKTLACLPERFQPFVTSWNLMAKEGVDPKLKDFTEKLLTTERGMADHARESHRDSDLALKVSKAGAAGRHAADVRRNGGARPANKSRDGGARPADKRRDFSRTKCFNCKEMGHLARDCKNPSQAGVKAVTALTAKTQEAIVADTGASRHITGRKDWFYSLEKLGEPIVLSTASDQPIRATHIGSVVADVSADGEHWSSKLWEDVLYVPGASSLFSTTWMERKGYSFRHGDKRAELISKSGQTVCRASWDGNVYRMMMRPRIVSRGSAAAASPATWHQRLGHLPEKQMQQMFKDGAVTGLKWTASGGLAACEPCILGKTHASSHPSKAVKRSCKAGERFHSDVCFANCTSLGGNRMFLTLKDEASGYRLLRFLKSTKEVGTLLIEMLDQAARETRAAPLSVRTDNGTEYVNSWLKAALLERRIAHETSAPYVKQGNGIAERDNRTLCDTARALLLAADLSNEERDLLWAEAVNCAAYLRNRIPNKRTGRVTPYEMWFGCKPGVSHLRIFGSPAYVHRQDKHPKLEAKARKTVFIGYDWQTERVIRVYNRSTRSVERVSDVRVLDEDVHVVRETGTSSHVDREDEAVITASDSDSADETESLASIDCDDHHISDQEAEKEEEQDDLFSTANQDRDEDELGRLSFSHPPESGSQETRDVRRTDGAPTANTRRKDGASSADVRRECGATSAGASRVPSKWKQPAAPRTHPMEQRQRPQAKIAVALDPISVTDAMSRSDAREWKAAMDDEMQSLTENKTWILVKKPEGKELVSCKWIFKSKTNPDGTLARRKARLVARGFTQREGVDYFETFSPVVRYESVRCILAIAAARDMEMTQFDVKTAFLNGDLKEDIFMHQPEGYDDKSGRVCKLRKSLYGLKQSPRAWNEKAAEFMRTQGLKPTSADPCVYTRRDRKQNVTLIVCLYVDDGLVCASSKKEADDFMSALKRAFDVTINEPKTYVGMEITRDRRRKVISFSQEGYLRRVLQRFGMESCTPLVVPMESAAKFDRLDSRERHDCPFREAIGCLNYLAIISRPDISFAVSKLSRYADCPQQAHWNGVKRVLRYLKGTASYCLSYDGKAPGILVGNSDSDWGGDPETRRSTSGFAFRLFSGAISWGSRRQSVAAWSVAEAEYMALAAAVKECLWLRPLLADLGLDCSAPTVIKVDNQAAINLSQNAEFHAKTKSISIQYHRVREEQNEQKTVAVRKVDGSENVADIFTKGVTSDVLARCLPKLHLGIPVQDRTVGSSPLKLKCQD